MRYVMLVAACLFLAAVAAAFLGGGFDAGDDITLVAEITKDIAGGVLAVASLYLWFPRRGGRRPTVA